ncbi:MAG: chemotaxis protein CheA [Desulfobacteraceae bacterium]|jgi:two-component system chemotaxis sensor kinase CheA
MPVDLDSINNRIETIALALVTMEADDIPVLGEILNHLNAIEKEAGAIENPQFSALINALGAYLERIILRETADIEPFESGIEHLQAFCRSLINQVDDTVDVSSVLSTLGGDSITDTVASAKTAAFDKIEETAMAALPIPDNIAEDLKRFGAPDPNLSEEDIEIFTGFVMESLEALESIEVGLIDLEQNPDDMESINTIFRSFHTIKGVSGFLGLERINKLSHCSENLLDKIRSGEINIDADATDVILNSVDLLKQMIEGVQIGMDNGTDLDNGIDVVPAITRIEQIQELATCGTKRLGEILVDQGSVSPQAVEKAVSKQKKSPHKKLGRILVEDGLADPGQVASALRKQKRSGARKIDLQVKVDTQKLDNLVDLAGELVIAQAMLRQHPYVLAADDHGLVHTLGQLNQITSSLQTMTMTLRMVPIKSTFQKMVRLVRDLARSSGKKILLTMEGEDTEIDRNVVDELYEPMVHMIRNSVDHGLETPEERIAAGKKAEGEIRLKAFHRGGKIVVEISDDGRGLNRSRILEKARSNGLISDDSKLSDDEINSLIFHPGFSTAKEVSDISGRGVGMDVVKKAIEKLRGRVDIQTTPGRGSTFVISLPLTLAIIEGMLVRIGQERYVLPALSIIESFRPGREQYSTVEGKGEMILSRGRLIPLVRLSKIFEAHSHVEAPWDGLVVVVEYDGKYMCLLLDELLGKEEVVIKSMGEIMKDVPGIAGGAIMGDGRVGLILDMAGIWQMAMRSPNAA